MQTVENNLIEDLRKQLESHVQLRLTQPPLTARSELTQRFKDMADRQKNSAKSARDITAWLANKMCKLKSFPSRLWPWSRTPREMCERIAHQVSKEQKSLAGMAKMLAAMHKQHEAMLARIQNLEGRLLRCEREHPAMIVAMSKEVCGVREAQAQRRESADSGQK